MRPEDVKHRGTVDPWCHDYHDDGDGLGCMRGAILAIFVTLIGLGVGLWLGGL
jgi:hypothetical protein